MSTPETALHTSFRERAAANDIPIGRLLGFQVKEIGEGRAVVTLTAGPQHANPMGTLHGGVLCDIGDAAMGIAFASTLAEGESFTTIEMKINFFRPVWNAELRAEGKVVRRGSSVGYVECEIADEQGRLVAKTSSTCMALRGERAKGR
jgi:uncharacterized protein (TIGR00369 family)